MRATTRVLLFELDPDLRRVLQALLAGEGFEVVVCSSLGEVLARAEGPLCEVAVIDVGYRGDRVLHEREQERLRCLGRLVPVVVIADEAWPFTLCREDIGAVAVLPKPFGLEAILSALEATAWASPPETCGVLQAKAEPAPE